ncbi:MAG: flagellar hook assembly protein FlgD [Bdellovibrionia bacterium]
MAQSMGNVGAAAGAVTQGGTVSGASSGGFQKDATESSTEPKFGDVMKKLQSQYGAKAEKPREIKKTLGKDDFLRIMITQMQHQDPSNPFKAEQMAAEMAQFTSVEQFQNMNRSLEKMTSKDQPMERLAMTGMIGKTVTVDRARFPHQEGSNEALVYNLPKEAASVKIALVSETGEVALEKDLGPQKPGENTFAWDGLKGNTLPAKTGNYMLRVEAKDDRGMAMDTGAQSQARVIGVSFEGSEPVFLVGDAKNQAKITMKNIIRVDDAGGAAPSFGGMGSAQNTGQAGPQSSAIKPVTTTQGKPNFIAFQKGVGSSNLDPNQLPKEAQEALAKFEGANAPTEKNEKGFPNGLHE